MSLPDNRVKEALKYCKDQKCGSCPYNTYGISCSNIMASDLFNLLNRYESEKDDLFYKLAGVMHSVDKWLEGDELKQDEVNRASTMREKTLQIVENLQAENESLKRTVNHTAKGSVKILEMVHEAKVDAYRDIIRKIKENSNKMGLVFSGELVRTDYTITEEKLDDVLKDFISKADDSTTTDKHNSSQYEIEDFKE